MSTMETTALIYSPRIDALDSACMLRVYPLADRDFMKETMSSMLLTSQIVPASRTSRDDLRLRASGF